MLLKEFCFRNLSRSDKTSLYVIGDAHVGALNCAEDKIVRLVERIRSDPNARWLGGGDMCDAVILNDTSRFDPSILPNWLLEGKNGKDVRLNLQDILSAQKRRLFKLLTPIKDQCLGLIEGNHEYTIMKHHNRDFMAELCTYFNCENLTDCAFLRFKFNRKVNYSQDGKPRDPTATIRGFICHGHGGGRTSGAEPNNLYRLAADKEVDFVLKGHSHTFCVHPPIPMLSIPSGGKLPEDPIVYDKHAANWGSFVYTYKTGPSTYASRANYPVRPMYTCEVLMEPWRQNSHNVETPMVSINSIRL